MNRIKSTVSYTILIIVALFLGVKLINLFNPHVKVGDYYVKNHLWIDNMAADTFLIISEPIPDYFYMEYYDPSKSKIDTMLIEEEIILKTFKKI